MALTQMTVQRVIRELEQVSVAVSVVGTSRVKLTQLGDMAEKVVGQLHGSRVEVDSVRKSARSAIDAMKRANLTQKAALAIEEVVDALKAIKGLLAKGFGVGPEEWPGAIPVQNLYGLTQKEAGKILRARDIAADFLRRINYSTKGIVVVLDPEWAEGKAVRYDPQWDTIVSDPTMQNQEFWLISAIAERMWVVDFRPEHREVWRDAQAFGDALGAFVFQTANLTSDMRSRLRVSIGQMTGSWPDKVATT